MKFCSVLPGSRQCCKFFRNYILRLHYMKSFIAVSRDLSFVLPGPHFVKTKFFHVIDSAHLSWMKKSINTCLQWKIKRKCFQIWTSARWKTVPPCRDEILFPNVIVGWNLSRLDGLKFHPGKPGSCNYHLRWWLHGPGQPGWNSAPFCRDPGSVINSS